MPYRSEKLEISPEEQARIQALLKRSGPATAPSLLQDRLDALVEKGPRKYILDTDIGTDIDDVLALICAIHLPNSDAQLLGITTNYYPTLMRRLVALSMLNACSDKKWHSVPVIAGQSDLLGTHRTVFLHGNEGEGVEEACEKKNWMPHQSNDAVNWIMDQLRQFPREVTIVSIGIPTNLGLCAARHGEEFSALVGHCVVMGGGSCVLSSCIKRGVLGVHRADKSLWPQGQALTKPLYPLPKDSGEVMQWLRAGATLKQRDKASKSKEKPKAIHLFPNHNVSGDTLATCLLFSLTCPISVIPHSITAQHWLEGRSIETLLDCGDCVPGAEHDCVAVPGEVAVGGRLLYEWLRRRHGQRGQCPHDPLTLYEAVYPTGGAETIGSDKDKFVAGCASLRYVHGTFVAHEWGAFMTFVPDPLGPHRVAVRAVEPEAWLRWLDDCLISGVPDGCVVGKSVVKTERDWT